MVCLRSLAVSSFIVALYSTFCTAQAKLQTHLRDSIGSSHPIRLKRISSGQPATKTKKPMHPNLLGEGVEGFLAWKLRNSSGPKDSEGAIWKFCYS